MHNMKPMMDGIRGLGKNRKADLYASFDAIRLQLAELRETASRDDSAEAKEARKSSAHFVALLEENGLWDYLVKLRDEARVGTSDSNPTE